MPDQTATSRSCPSTKLGDILMSDKRTLSYADFHHQITKNTDGRTEVKAEKDELVRYMSNLPSYLEKGKSFQEKPLNVGVLDWQRLEKWTYTNEQMPNKNSGYSSSTSTASSSQSSRGQISSPMKKFSQDYNRSPSHQRTYHLVPHSHYQKVYPLEGCSHKVRQQNLCEKYKSCTVKESGVKINSYDADVVSSTKGKLKIRESELKEAMQSRLTPNQGVNHQDFSKERNKVVLLVPRTDLKESTPSRSRNVEKKPSIVVLKSSVPAQISGEMNNNTVKVRHPSPIRRLSSAVGNIVKSVGSRDNTPLRRSSSPLRRLLDPLIKPKSTNDSTVNVKSTFVSAKTKDVKDSSLVQALLQVGVNNGLPVFTFAVENDSDNILAATLSKQKYTFLSVRGMKKKNGMWANQGCKGKGQYIPNVVAQMTVSDQNFTNGERTREFNLFAVDVGQGDQNGAEFQPTNELAAIVVKLVRANATVILPGGVHTIPSKGSISTLTERWRSGGSCDCGGWDLGCQLRVFKSSCKTANVSDEFKLYHQVGQEIELVLRVKPIKERIYSVEFNSSMSLLQAFGTCVAVLDCKILSGVSSVVNGVEGRSSASYVSYPPHSPVSRA